MREWRQVCSSFSKEIQKQFHGIKENPFSAGFLRVFFFQLFRCCQMIERYKRDQKRNRIGICPVLLPVAIVADMTSFHPLRAGNHDNEDQKLSRQSDDPLSAFQRSDAGNDSACPEEDLAEIVRTAAQRIQSFHRRHIRRLFLLRAFLLVCRCLKDKTEHRYRTADIHEDTRGNVVKLCPVRKGLNAFCIQPRCLSAYSSSPLEAITF